MKINLFITVISIVSVVFVVDVTASIDFLVVLVVNIAVSLQNP